jgi:RNA polymerase sigma factor (sigma-70 family)
MNLCESSRHCIRTHSLMSDQVTIHAEVDIRQLLAAGDPAAFKRLYDQHRSVVYKAAYSVLRSREETLETLQEVFLKVWILRTQFRNVKSLEHYLYAMARNKAVSLLLKRKRELRFLLTETWETALSPSPHVIIEEAEYDAVYEFVLEKLTLRQRMIFKMTREENMSHEAIAKQLDISPNTVNNHIKAALTTIRHLLSTVE